MMLVVSDLEQLNWWLRRFAPCIVIRVAPEFIEARASAGTIHARTTLWVVTKGERIRILGIGDEVVTDASAMRMPIFETTSSGLDTSVDRVSAFLRIVLKRLPPRWSIIRPVIVVEGLNSPHQPLGGTERDVFVRALANCGVAAVVLGD